MTTETTDKTVSKDKKRKNAWKSEKDFSQLRELRCNKCVDEECEPDSGRCHERSHHECEDHAPFHKRLPNGWRLSCGAERE